MISVTGASLVSSGLSTTLNAMRQELGFTNTQTGLVLTIRSISAFFAALVSAKYFEKLGIRMGMVVAMLFGAFTFLLFHIGGANLLIVYAGAVLSGICYSYGMMLPASMLLHNWFNKSRGVALSIASAGTAVVSMVFAPVIQSMVNESGIFSAYRMIIVVFIAIAIIDFLFIRETPEKLGLEIYGGKDYKHEQDGKNVEPREATALSGGWLIGIVIATVCTGFAASPYAANFTNHYVSAGIDTMAVAKAISIYGTVLIISKLVFGVVVDKIGTYKTTILYGYMCMLAIAVAASVALFPRVPLMYAGLLLSAIFASIQTMGYPNWIVDLDSQHYNKTISKCQTGYQFGAVVGSFIPGVIADITGNYGIGFALMALAMGISTTLAIGAYRSQTKKRKKKKKNKVWIGDILILLIQRRHS